MLVPASSSAPGLQALPFWWNRPACWVSSARAPYSPSPAHSRRSR